MNTMAQAIKDVGIAVPVKKRIWMWLRDHPNKNAREISLALHIVLSHVHTSLREMTDRGMVKSKAHYHAHHSGPGKKTIFEYCAVGDTYELMPIRKTPQGQSSPPTVVKFEPAPVVAPNSKIDVDAMPLAEARRVYEELRKIFGENNG
jgi:hypothetical protein